MDFHHRLLQGTTPKWFSTIISSVSICLKNPHLSWFPGQTFAFIFWYALILLNCWSIIDNFLSLAGFRWLPTVSHWFFDSNAGLKPRPKESAKIKISNERKIDCIFPHRRKFRRYFQNHHHILSCGTWDVVCFVKDLWVLKKFHPDAYKMALQIHLFISKMFIKMLITWRSKFSCSFQKCFLKRL